MPARAQSPSTPQALAVRAVETTAIRVPRARTYRGSQYQMTHRSTTICRIHRDAGIVGAAWAGDGDASLGEIQAIIGQEIAPLLIGEEAYAVERTWQLARPATFNILRDRRLGLVVSVCVHAALWDAVGKALGQPLWRLWGGFRSELPLGWELDADFIDRYRVSFA
jgi:L-alanine-DL-glutamate epimerase-like enolase superfamily enzyme